MELVPACIGEGVERAKEGIECRKMRGSRGQATVGGDDVKAAVRQAKKLSEQRYGSR